MHQTKDYSFAAVAKGARGKRSKTRRVSAFLLSYAATAIHDDRCTSKKKDYEGLLADERG
jgi:hypothetical protein